MKRRIGVLGGGIARRHNALVGEYAALAALFGQRDANEAGGIEQINALPGSTDGLAGEGLLTRKTQGALVVRGVG
ncbi:MAG: hypothetical protein H0T73_08035 [Ardenticatenales bacterium]|nr:hypothetical protein [Ardenticatenales bacterium]